MNTIFMNSRNSKTSGPYRLLLNLTDKIDLRIKDKYIALSNLSIYYTWKIIKYSNINNKFKIYAPTWNEEFELPDDHILYQIFKIIVNPSIRMYINKVENRITFKINTGYDLELLVPRAMKLLGSTKSKITKDENGENVSY